LATLSWICVKSKQQIYFEFIADMARIRKGKKNMTHTILDYFAEYRQKIAESNNLIEKERELYREAEQVRTMKNQLQLELTGMEKLITIMITNDWDPVEAKLKTTSDELHTSFWNTGNEPETLKYANSLANTAYGITGATGSISNMGAISAHGGAYTCANYNYNYNFAGLTVSSPTVSLSGAMGSSYQPTAATGANGGTGSSY
jgi:hypothetical protein